MKPVADLIPIKSSTMTVQQCFRTCLYVVPEFQRPYSWGVDELEDYWSDVVLARGEFFFGSTVTWVSEVRTLFNDSYSIIDGQQRLTTSAIILSVIRDFFASIVTSEDVGAAEFANQVKLQADATQKYLVNVDDDGIDYPVILREEPNFREVVQEPNAIPSGKKWNGSAVQIGVARTFFENRVKSEISGKSPEVKVDILKGIRSNVLKARLIQVELSTEEDGFLIFETLNARGADLRASDLVKNLLVRGCAVNPSGRRTVADRWQRVVDRVQASKVASAVDKFLWQSWNSRRAAVTEAGLYKAIRQQVGVSPQAHLDYLAELEFDSIVYQYLDDADLVIDKSDLGGRSALLVPEVIDAVRALAIFNVSVANSAILAAVRKYESTRFLSKSKLIRACRSIENFHFQFSALKNSGSTGGTRARYNGFAVDLEQACSVREVDDAIASLQVKLASSLPSSVEAKAAFESLFYAPKVRLTAAQKPRSRKLFIAYVLLRCAQEGGAVPYGQDPTIWTIEHIRPQSAASGRVGDPEYSIGNLALLTSGANGDLGNDDFSQKRARLEEQVPYRDSQLLVWLRRRKMSEVTAVDIKERAAALAKFAIDVVWVVRAP